MTIVHDIPGATEDDTVHHTIPFEEKSPKKQLFMQVPVIFTVI